MCKTVALGLLLAVTLTLHGCGGGGEPTPSPTPGPPPGPLPLPGCVDGVITLLAARYSDRGMPRNCSIRGQPGSVIVGVSLDPWFSEELRIEGTLQFDAFDGTIGELFVRGSVAFTNCGESAFYGSFGSWSFERSRVVFQNCSFKLGFHTRVQGAFTQFSNSTVILIDSYINYATVVFESSQVNMTRAGLRSIFPHQQMNNIRINNTTMSLISSFIVAGSHNRQISIANSVMSLHNSSLLHGGDTIVIPLQFVNTTATFTGSSVFRDFIKIDAYVRDVPAVSFVDSWVSFPNCSSLDQVIYVSDGNISIKGGRVWCVSNTTMTAEDNAQIATAMV